MLRSNSRMLRPVPYPPGIYEPDHRVNLDSCDFLKEIKIKSAVIYHRVMETLDLFGISHKANHYPEFISGGEQQRTAIARAIIHQPFVLIADEPTGNLDHELAQEIMQILEKICAQGTTVLVATHDSYLIEKYQKRRIEIKAGSIQGIYK